MEGGRDAHESVNRRLPIALKRTRLKFWSD